MNPEKDILTSNTTTLESSSNVKDFEYRGPKLCMNNIYERSIRIYDEEYAEVIAEDSDYIKNMLLKYGEYWFIRVKNTNLDTKFAECMRNEFEDEQYWVNQELEAINRYDEDNYKQYDSDDEY